MKYLTPPDSETGEMLIKNHTEANVGSYMCEAKNAVGRVECRYELHAYNRESLLACSLQILTQLAAALARGAICTWCVATQRKQEFSHNILLLALFKHASVSVLIC